MHFIRLSILQTYLKDLFLLFLLYVWFDSQGPRVPTIPILLVIAKNLKHMVS